MASTTPIPLASLPEFLASHSEPLVIEFWQRGCPHCETMATRLRYAAAKLAPVRIYTVEVRGQSPVLDSLEVEGTPTHLLFTRGKEHSRLVGLVTSTQMATWVSRMLALERPAQSERTVA